MHCSYGTGAFLLMNAGHQCVISKVGLLSTVAFQMGPDAVRHYALEVALFSFPFFLSSLPSGVRHRDEDISNPPPQGSIAVAGSGLSWLKNQMGVLESEADASVMASAVPDNGNVFFVPAFSGLFAPHWEHSARGLLLVFLLLRPSLATSWRADLHALSVSLCLSPSP